MPPACRRSLGQEVRSREAHQPGVPSVRHTYNCTKRAGFLRRPGRPFLRMAASQHG
jgi:hypothetical protein